MNNKVDRNAVAQWRHLYEAAVLELDPTRLLSRIAEARRAILQELESTTPDRNEAEVLTSALQVLKDLDRIGMEDGRADVA